MCRLGNYQVFDPEYNRLGFSIHNYFAAKMLDQVRPGGIVAFVTSRYTMDAKDESVRRYLAARGELLGAIRLPNNAFRANAGTEVVTDIIFLQRREAPLTELPGWVYTGENEDGFKVKPVFPRPPGNGARHSNRREHAVRPRRTTPSRQSRVRTWLNSYARPSGTSTGSTPSVT